MSIGTVPRAPPIDHDRGVASTAIGKRLKELREKRGISQHELARRSGLRGNYISRLEKGTRGARIGADTLTRLAIALGTHPNALTGQRGELASELPESLSAALADAVTRDEPIEPGASAQAIALALDMDEDPGLHFWSTVLSQYSAALRIADQAIRTMAVAAPQRRATR